MSRRRSQRLIFLSLQVSDSQTCVGFLPCALKLATDQLGLALLPPRLEALGQAVERAAVAPVAGRVSTKARLGLGVLLIAHERAAQSLARERVIPAGRLVVGERVLGGDGLSQEVDGGLAVAARLGQPPG